MTDQENNNARIDAVEKQGDERAEYMEKAVQTAQSVLADRLQSMNEFRAQIREQQATYVTLFPQSRLP